VRRQATVLQAVPTAPGAATTVNESVAFDGRYTSDLPLADDSKNYGAVFHALRDYHGLGLSFFGNYAESFRPVAGNISVLGAILDPIKGKGREYGVRLEAFGGKLALNTVFYEIRQTNSPAAVAANVRTEINNLFFSDTAGTLLPGALVAPALNANGDTVSLTSKGYEMELTLNVRRGWTLTANYSDNNKRQEDIYPRILPFYRRAVQENRPLNTYATLNNLLAPALANADLVAPETKESLNFFTRHEITEGRLKGLRLGVGTNYRSPTYVGNISTGPLYNDRLLLVSGLIGYGFPLRRGQVQVTLNISNATDEFEYRAASTGAGEWVTPREYRLNASYRF
jgi:outer membrane receptor for ferric coprogen and ferric-rhodotorulic acid